MLIDARFFIFIEATIGITIVFVCDQFVLSLPSVPFPRHAFTKHIMHYCQFLLFKPICFAILLVPNMLNVQESYELEEVKILLCKSVSC